MAVYRMSKEGKPQTFIKQALKNYDHQPSFFMMLAINLIPVAGVLFFGWSAYQVFGLYMLESFIIGLFNVLKLFVVDFNGNKPANDESGAAIGFINIPFFLLHFNFFLVVQFILFNSFTTIHSSNAHSAFDIIYYTKNLVSQIPVFAIGGIVLNQLYSFTSDFIITGRYKVITPGRLLFQLIRAFLYSSLLLFWVDS